MDEKQVRPQTWDEDAENVIHSVAHWMLVESVAANHSWTTLNASSGLVDRGMEMVQKVAAQRGIHPGHVVATPDDLLAAMKDVAMEHNAPAAPLPLWQPEAAAPGKPAAAPQPKQARDPGKPAE